MNLLKAANLELQNKQILLLLEQEKQKTILLNIQESKYLADQETLLAITLFCGVIFISLMYLWLNRAGGPGPGPDGNGSGGSEPFISNKGAVLNELTISEELSPMYEKLANLDAQFLTDMSVNHSENVELAFLE